MSWYSLKSTMEDVEKSCKHRQKVELERFLNEAKNCKNPLQNVKHEARHTKEVSSQSKDASDAVSSAYNPFYENPYAETPKPPKEIEAKLP